MLRRAVLFAVPLALLAGLAEVRADEENPIVTLVKSKLPEKGKPFAITVTFKAQAGAEGAFERAFVPCLASTRREPGCVAYYLNRDVDDPSVFVMYEQFASVAALEAHAKTPHVAELLKKIGPLLDGAPAVKVYSVAGE